MPRRRSWFQFSTRSLLLILTGLCGWLGNTAESARRQRDAVKVLGDAASVGYDDGGYSVGPHQINKKPPGILGSLESWLGRDYFDRVNTIMFFREPQIAPAHLNAVTNLPYVRTLDLCNASIDDCAFAQLGKLDRLSFLSLMGSSVTDAGLEHVARFPRLEVLGLKGLPIDGSGLNFLARVPRLELIDLRETHVDDKHIAALGGCRHLRMVDVRDTRVTSAGVRRLKKALPNCEIRWQDLTPLQN